MDARKLDLNLLITLEALLAERNVTRAAERIGLSQPAVSAQLARLRDIFEDQLLIPAQRGMTPTARALELQQPLRQALDTVRDAVTNVGDFEPERATMTFAIGAADTGHYAFSLPVIEHLRTVAPGVRIALRDMNWNTIDKDLESGTLDFAMVIPDDAVASLRSRKLYDSSWSFIARKNHPVVRGSIDLDQFVALDHVLTEPGRATFEGVANTALKALGRSRRVVVSVANFLVAVEVVARTDMVAIVPTGITRGRGDKLQVLQPPLKIEPFPLLLVWHERTHGHSAYRWFRNLYADVAANL